MGNYDDAVYRYLSDNDRFADLFNAVFFGGREVLKGNLLEADAERCMDMSPEEERHAGMPDAVHPKPRSRGCRLTGQPRTVGWRDIKKRLKTGESFVVTAVENQSEIDYAMPWRIMRYDQAEYGRQIAELQRKHRREREKQGLPPSRWAEKLGKEDLLMPVYTICFYHGTEKWNGPRSLKDMMRFPEGSLGAPAEGTARKGSREASWQEHFHDYGMTLFCADEPGNLNRFRTELKQLLNVLVLRQDKEALLKLWEQEEYTHIDRETAETIAVLTDRPQLIDKLGKYEEEGGSCNMCLAMDELEKDWEEEGIQKGIQKGIQIGRVTGKSEGKAEGIIETALDCGLSERDILERLQAKLDISLQKAQEYFAMFGKQMA